MGKGNNEGGRGEGGGGEGKGKCGGRDGGAGAWLTVVEIILDTFVG